MTLENYVREQAGRARAYDEASYVVARYIASLASPGPTGKMDDDTVYHFPDRRLIDPPKTPVRIGDRSVLFFRGLSWDMCVALSRRTLENVEGVSLNDGPVSDRYDGSQCRADGRRSSPTNWITVIRKPVPRP